MVVAENTAAHAPHHWAMPSHKGRKSRLVAAANVVRKQLPIGQARTIPQKDHPAKVLDDLAHLIGRHLLSFVG